MVVHGAVRGNAARPGGLSRSACKGLSLRAARLQATVFCQARQKKAKALLTGRAPGLGGRPRLRRSCRAQPRGLPTAGSGRWSTIGRTCVPRGCPPGQIVFDRYPGSGKLARDKLLVSQRDKRFSAPQRYLTGNPAPFAQLVEALLGTFEATVKSTSPASGRSPRGETPLFLLWTRKTNPQRPFAPRYALAGDLFCQSRQKKAKALLTSGAYRGRVSRLRPWRQESVVDPDSGEAVKRNLEGYPRRDPVDGRRQEALASRAVAHRGRSSSIATRVAESWRVTSFSCLGAISDFLRRSAISQATPPRSHRL